MTLSFSSAVLQTEEAQHQLKALEAKLAPRKAHLQSLSTEVENTRKQLQDLDGKLSDAERNARAQTLNNEERQLQREAEDFKSDSQAESQEIFQKVAQQLYSFLQIYSKQHGYSFVIERGSDASPVVWYAANNMDITDQIVKAYDTQGGTASPQSSDGSINPKRTNEKSETE